MNTIAMFRPKFDIVEYIKKLRSVGMSQEFAEMQAQEMEHALESVLEQAKEASNHKDLATKGNLDIIQQEFRQEFRVIRAEIKETELRLQKDIKELEVRLITRLMTLYGAGFLILLGILAKGFHWL